MDKKALKSASDLLARMQGGIKWELLERGVELEVDLSVLKMLPGYSPLKTKFELQVGADRVVIDKVGELYGVVRLKVGFKK